MANKTVHPVDIALHIKGAEKVPQLKGLFRDLSKTFKVADSDLRLVREGINDYARSANQSEAVIRGQIKAFEGLREQAARGGQVYSDLSSDIQKLKEDLRGSSSAVEAKRESLVRLGTAAKASADDLRFAISQLEKLKSKVREDSAAFSQLNKDISGLNVSLKDVNITAAKARFTISQALAVKPEKIVSQLERMRSAIASGTLEAKDLARALKDIELLSVGAGRASAARRAEAFGDRIGTRYFESLRKDYKDLEKTSSIISQRISEVNTELANVTGYERRRALTIELINLNKELRRAVVDVRTAEEFQGLAIRQRMGRAREAYGASGFGAFSAEMRQRTAAGEFTPGMERARERAKNRGVNEEAVKGTLEIFKTWTDAYDQIEDAARRHSAEMVRIQGGQTNLLIEQQDRAAEKARSLQQAQFDREIADFDARLARAGRLKSGEFVSRQALGLGGGELSPFYEGVVGIGTSRARGQQELMGRSPIQALNDITDTFNRDLRRSGDARLEAERQVRETLVKEFGAGSQKLRAVLERIPAGKLTMGQLPGAGEDFSSYIKRLESSTRGLDGVLTDFGRKTTNELRQARQSLVVFRDELDPTTASFSKLESTAVRSIEKIDRELQKRERGRRRMSPMQMTQAAGAAISGGIFGGPEGFVGGVGGALLGGVGGAFAGAAVGAQVGGVRRTLGEYADYAAQIEKLKIALEGIAGPTDQYNRALAAAANVTKSLNVPQEVAIQGITRLTAAVKGAGGGVADAELAFKNINAAIIATGGGADQVQGAVTALVQIFSKGKVSAEEINQIAERLPGTFNKIAAASGRTGPELTKALQKGQVGLNDLMKFLVSLGDEYGDLSRKIAGSSENAGARLQVAFNKMRIEVGKALQPIGAEFQDIFKGFIEEITPTLVKVLPKIGEAFLAIAKNIDTVAVAIAGAIAVFAVGKISTIIASIGSLSAAIFTLKLNATVAAKALVGLNGAALLNPYTALAAGAALLATNIYNAAKNQKALNGLIREGTVSEIDAELKKLDQKRAKIESRMLEKGGDPLYTTAQSGTGISKRDLDQAEVRRIMGVSKQLINRRQAALKDLTQGAAVDLSQLTVFADPKLDSEDATKGIKDISKLEADLIIARTKLNEEDLLARKEFIRAEAEIARQLADAEPFHKRRAALAQIAQKEAEALARVDEEMKKGAEQMVKDLADQRKERKRIDDELKQSLAARKLELGLITQEEFNQLEIQRERARLQELQAGGFISAEGVEEQMKVFKQLLNQTPIDKFVKQAKDSLNDLQTVAVNVAQGIGNAIGNALTNGVTNLIEGTRNAKEVFADFLKSVGQILAQEGAKQIATYIAIGVAKAFAGLAGGGGPDPNSANVGSVLEGGGFTTGNLADAAASTPLRANGGPVNAGRPYMVGERGPELFLPGSNGGIMRNEEMRQLMGRSPAGAGGGAAAMNFTFETTNIGGTEYVSREQLEAAMATTRRQAANDGAKRGMSMTLDKMQNSPRTRSRIGIG